MVDVAGLPAPGDAMDLRSINFDQRPFIAIWETTQACDLACVHCRACAQPARNPLELNTDDAKQLIDDIAAMEVPVFVLTGGDPLKRPDIFDLVQYATERGVRISLTPSATPLLTRENIVRLQQCGLVRLAVSLDGPTAEIHDAFRRVPGSYEWTIDAVRWAREIDLPVQINTTITRHNLTQLDDTIALLEKLDIALWSVFFLVPTGRGQSIDLISAEEFEQVFEKLYETSQRVMFDIKSTEAQHYRRFLLQRRTEVRRRGEHPFTSNNACLSCAQMPIGMQTHDGIGRAQRDQRRQRFRVYLAPGRGLSQRLPAGLRRKRSQAVAVRHLSRLAAVPLFARQQESAREVRPLRVSRNLRRLARPRVRHDRRHVRRGALLRV